MDLDEKKTVKRAKLETKKTGADVYEQYWMSDEELDSEELGELTKDGVRGHINSNNNFSSCL